MQWHRQRTRREEQVDAPGPDRFRNSSPALPGPRRSQFKRTAPYWPRPKHSISPSRTPEDEKGWAWPLGWPLGVHRAAARCHLPL